MPRSKLIGSVWRRRLSNPRDLWSAWWRRLSPNRQDRFAVLAPLVSVGLFLAAVAASFSYLRVEEAERELQAVQRDVEYTQQQLRLRLLERQEQLMRLARDIGNRESDSQDFLTRAELMVVQYPELQGLYWVNDRRQVVAAQATPSLYSVERMVPGARLRPGEMEATFGLARELRQPVYATLQDKHEGQILLQLHIPMHDKLRFVGVLLAEYSLDGLMRYAVPTEVAARYAVSLMDDQKQVIAGQALVNRGGPGWWPWAPKPSEYSVPVPPVGNSLVLKAQAYRTSLGLVGTGLFWLVLALSVMTSWMLIATWRHTRRRMQAQKQLVAETNFRRAMENSMPTGMRALDLAGRITYVNAAFCRMTGWSESELVGCTAPFPYWPDEDRDFLMERLADEINGRTTPGGFQVRVKRRDGEIFDARMYVSPLIDPLGRQTGWMTSMTDITEPNRIREQLSASYNRFTTVLEALDAAVSVVPLSGDEVLFANRLYRLWFGLNAEGHRQLVHQAVSHQAGPPPTLDAIDDLAGLPTDALTSSDSEHAEVFVPALGQWLEVRSSYLTWVDNRLAQMVIATDITPRRRAEQLAEQHAERAQASSRLITMGEMASSVAHELNQPLTAISNYCSGMLSRIRGGQIGEQDLLKALEKTAHQAQRAGQIIQRIRSFVKRSEPNRTLSEVPVMVAEAVELAEIELRRRSVRLNQQVASRLPQLLVDPILIEQVLVNLLRNAAEAVDQAQRPVGQRLVELQVQAQTVDQLAVVVFSVRDSGQGIAPELVERVFEPFLTTKAGGMGIGLNLCRSIVESHQGRLEFRNLYNGSAVVGCLFSFWIPAPRTLPLFPPASPGQLTEAAGPATHPME